MPATIHVDLAREVDGADLVEALAARGLEGELVGNGDGRVTVRVRPEGEESRRLCGDFSHLLEAWIYERGLPLVPARLDEESYVVRPPAG